MDQLEEVALRDEQAEGYDAFYMRSRGYWSYAVREAVRAALRLKSGDVLLDAGCGTGLHSVYFAPMVAKLIGVDFSKESLRIFEEKCRRQGIANVETQLADITSLSFEAGLVDKACSIEVIQHIPGEEARLQAVRAIYHALRPAGLFVMVVYRWWGWMKPPKPKEGYVEGTGLYRFAFTKDEAARLFQRGGFKRVRVYGTMNIPKWLRKRLPPSFVFVDTLVSRFSFSSTVGRMLLVVGEK